MPEGTDPAVWATGTTPAWAIAARFEGALFHVESDSRGQLLWRHYRLGPLATPTALARNPELAARSRVNHGALKNPFPEAIQALRRREWICRAERRQTARTDQRPAGARQASRRLSRIPAFPSWPNLSGRHCSEEASIPKCCTARYQNLSPLRRRSALTFSETSPEGLFGAVALRLLRARRGVVAMPTIREGTPSFTPFPADSRASSSAPQSVMIPVPGRGDGFPNRL